MPLPRNSLLFAALAVALAGPALAATPTSRADAGRITRLIEQLGSEEFREREAASRELAAIGEPAVEALRKAMSSTDAEVRHRGRGLLRAIAGPRDRAALQGFWVLKTTEYLGLKAEQDPTEDQTAHERSYRTGLPEERGLDEDFRQYRTTLEFKGDTFERREWVRPFGARNGVASSTIGTWILDTSRSPSLMAILWGIPGGGVGCRYCVYSVRGDTLQMCVTFTNDPNGLPKRLATDRDEDVVLLTFKREKTPMP